jgi:hypothetical protein
MFVSFSAVNKSWEELRLPPGYQLELDPDMLVLRRPDGSAAAELCPNTSRRRRGKTPPEARVETAPEPQKNRPSETKVPPFHPSL